MDSNGQERLRYLEHLVTVLRRQLAERGGSSEDSSASSAKVAGAKPPTDTKLPETPGDLSGVKITTPAGNLVGDLRFVDAANWEAILDDVSHNFSIVIGLRAPPCYTFSLLDKAPAFSFEGSLQSPYATIRDVLMSYSCRLPTLQTN